MFVAIVLGAVAPSAIVGPLMRWALRRRIEVNVEKRLLRRGVIGALGAANRDEAIHEVFEFVNRQGQMLTEQQLVLAALPRENEVGTAIAGGMAIPHARPENLKTPVIVVGGLTAGIEWNSVEGEPTRLILSY